MRSKLVKIKRSILVNFILTLSADEYYSFKYLIVCLLSGEIVETLGYYEKELFTICEEIMIESAKEI